MGDKNWHKEGDKNLIFLWNVCDTCMLMKALGSYTHLFDILNPHCPKSNTCGFRIGKGVPLEWTNFSTWMKSIRIERPKRSMNWGSAVPTINWRWMKPNHFISIQVASNRIAQISPINSKKLLRDNMYCNQTKHCCSLSIISMVSL